MHLCFILYRFTILIYLYVYKDFAGCIHKIKPSEPIHKSLSSAKSTKTKKVITVRLKASK